MIHRISEIDFDKISYSAPVNIQNNIVVYINYNKTSPLLVTVPSLLAIDQVNDKNEILLSLTAKDDKNNNSVREFFKQLDQKFINDIKINAKTWKIKTNNVSYKALVNIIEENQAGIIKFKIIEKEDFATRVYNKEKQQLNKEEYKNVIKKDCYIKSIIEISSIWFNSENIVIFIKTHQIRVSFKKKPLSLDVYAFSDSDDQQQDNVTAIDFTEEPNNDNEEENNASHSDDSEVD